MHCLRISSDTRHQSFSLTETEAFATFFVFIELYLDRRVAFATMLGMDHCHFGALVLCSRRCKVDCGMELPADPGLGLRLACRPAEEATDADRREAAGADSPMERKKGWAAGSPSFGGEMPQDGWGTESGGGLSNSVVRFQEGGE